MKKHGRVSRPVRVAQTNNHTSPESVPRDVGERVGPAIPSGTSGGGQRV